MLTCAIYIANRSWSMLLAFDICGQNLDLTDSGYHPVDIPACDWYLDPDCSNDVEMPFYRVLYQNITTTITNQTKYVIGLKYV